MWIQLVQNDQKQVWPHAAHWVAVLNGCGSRALIESGHTPKTSRVMAERKQQGLIAQHQRGGCGSKPEAGSPFDAPATHPVSRPGVSRSSASLTARTGPSTKFIGSRGAVGNRPGEDRRRPAIAGANHWRGDLESMKHFNLHDRQAFDVNRATGMAGGALESSPASPGAGCHRAQLWRHPPRLAGADLGSCLAELHSSDRP